MPDSNEMWEQIVLSEPQPTPYSARIKQPVKETEKPTPPLAGLELERWYSGSFLGRAKGQNTEEKMARKSAGLPITKELVYYPNKHVNKTVPIKEWKAVYGVVNNWLRLVAKLATGEEIKIYSFYLNDMQSPSFVADMRASEKAALEEE